MRWVRMFFPWIVRAFALFGFLVACLAFYQWIGPGKAEPKPEPSEAEILASIRNNVGLKADEPQVVIDWARELKTRHYAYEYTCLEVPSFDPSSIKDLTLIRDWFSEPRNLTEEILKKRAKDFERAKGCISQLELDDPRTLYLMDSANFIAPRFVQAAEIYVFHPPTDRLVALKFRPKHIVLQYQPRYIYMK